MNIINMPGFAAEISLYKTSGHYQPIVNQGSIDRAQRVIFQIRAGGIGSHGFLGGFLCGFSCAAQVPACLELCRGVSGCKESCDQQEYWCRLQCAFGNRLA